jgi:Trk K+ transport system NAD-binding subunit
LSESTPVGSSIGQVQANDHDRSVDFRRVQYQLIDNENNHMIEIDVNNGSLYLTRTLSAGITFNVTVMAIDQHNHSLFDQANVEILLYDDATCLPMFSQTLYRFNTTEHRKTPYFVGKDFVSIEHLSMTHI